MDEEIERQAQEYFKTPLVNRAISVIDELSDVDPSNPPNPTGNPFRDVITKAYCDSVLVTQGCFPEEKAYRFMFLVPEIQAYTGMLVVHVISDSGKEAMKQGLTVCSIFGGQLCSVRLPFLLQLLLDQNKTLLHTRSNCQCSNRLLIFLDLFELWYRQSKLSLINTIYQHLDLGNVN